MNTTVQAFSKPSKRKESGNQVRQEIKEQLIKHMFVGSDQYKIVISVDDWHKIFKTK